MANSSSSKDEQYHQNSTTTATNSNVKPPQTTHQDNVENSHEYIRSKRSPTTYSTCKLSFAGLSRSRILSL